MEWRGWPSKVKGYAPDGLPEKELLGTVDKKARPSGKRPAAIKRNSRNSPMRSQRKKERKKGQFFSA